MNNYMDHVHQYNQLYSLGHFSKKHQLVEKTVPIIVKSQLTCCMEDNVEALVCKNTIFQ